MNRDGFKDGSLSEAGSYQVAVDGCQTNKLIRMAAGMGMVALNDAVVFGLAAIASIIGSVGALAFGIGVVLTIPIQICILTVAYHEIFDDARPSSTPDFTSEESF